MEWLEHARIDGGNPTSDDLRAAEPFLWHVIASAIPRALRGTHEWRGVRRYRFSFQPAAELWALDFTPREAGSPVVGYVARRDGETIFIDFDWPTFARAFGGQGLAITTDNALEYLHLHFALGDSARDAEELVADPARLEFAAPPADEDERSVRAQIHAFVPAVEAVDEDGDIFCRALIRRGRRLFERRYCLFTGDRPSHGATAGEVSIARKEDPRVAMLAEGAGEDAAPARLGLERAPEAADDASTRGWAWAGQGDFRVRKTLLGRRVLEEREEQLRLDRVAQWRPAGTAADIAETTRASEAAYRRRADAYPWETILPSARAELEGEAQDFVEAINRRCPDLFIDAPKSSRSGRGDGGRGADDRSAFVVRRKSLPFYPGFGLYEVIERAAGRPRATQLLWAPDPGRLPAALRGVDLLPLYGTSHLIHQLNAAFAIRLDGDVALEYLAFFCDAVAGEGGRFHVVETPEDLRWRGLSAGQRRGVSPLLFPIRLWPADQGDGEAPLVLDACVVYGMSLFRADFALSRNGAIEMTEDHPLIARLEITPEIWTAKTHFLLRQPEPAEASREPS